MKETRTTPAVSIGVAMRAGSASDPAGREGTAWLLSRVIDRGTLTKSASQIAEALDDRGVTLSISVTRHLLTMACTCLAEDFDVVFALLGEMMTSPSLPEDEIAIRKGEVVTAIRQDEDNPAIRANDGLMSRLFPDGHPYGRRTKGSIEFVTNLTRDDLLSHHRAHFSPSGLIGVVVGDVPSRRVLDVANQVFGAWTRPPAQALSIPPARRATERTTTIVPMMNKAQTDIAYGFTAIKRRDPDYHAAWLMNNVFGQYAIGGRLGDSIRERQGMAYYVSSSLDANVGEGPLTIRAGVSPANVDRAIASIDEEIARLVRDGITAKELEESRRFLIGSMPRALETNASIANFLQQVEFFDLGLDYDLQLPDRLRAVTLDAANAVARRLLDAARATIVVAGPVQRDAVK
ncbi:MAG TPA: pitrilysin family protein [Vicinamibacterales bacterium]